MVTFNPSISVLQARMQAWCVNLLSIPVDAYQLGAVIGKGAPVRAVGSDALYPDVMFVSGQDRKAVQADAIYGAPLLAIDMLHSGVPERERAGLRARYAAAHVLEYWQIDVDRGQPHFYQASAAWQYDRIEPDNAGMHFSTAIVELSFPAVWFRRQPDLWTMMAYWGMIEDLGK
ncbi:MAG: Uma2 family endonuclease [Chloroflexi bacterium]|nr:Uma2 family endonuclease [Chloroflexota bacterium]MCL5275072.1 Uma2 family endonuclease [Chloroflexota bacterium]